MRRHPTLFIFLIVATLYLSGWFAAIDRAVMDLGFESMRRDPSGLVVLVEVDAKSLKALQGWPVPYRDHASVIDRLVKAGAWRIGFDGDLSSRANPAAQAVLAAAIRRADRRVILPVFRLQTVGRSGRMITTYSDPPPGLRKGAILATTNIDIAPDGRVRKYATRDAWRAHRIPSLAARLAGLPKSAPDFFYIDYGIRADRIRRLSYIDVLQGKFDPSTIKRKIVLIGATAPKVGDRIPVPAYGVLMGPELHAMAYESLAQGRAITPMGWWITVAFALFTAFASREIFSRISWSLGGILAIVSVPACVAAGVFVQGATPFKLDTTPWWIVTLLSYAFHVIRSADRHSLFLATQRNLAAQRRAMLNSVVEESFDGIVIVNDRGTIQLTNPTANRMLGLSRGIAVARPLEALIPEFGALLDEAVSGGEWEIASREIRIEREGGKSFIAEAALSVSTLKDSGDPRSKSEFKVYIFTFRDITERKRIEEAERKAMEQAIAASRAKSEFLANVSHELRTPLNAIIGFSEILNGEMFGPLGSEQYKGYVDDIHTSGTHLLEVINDILDMSKIEAGEMSLQEAEMDVADVARSCLRLIAERASHAGLTIVENIPEDLPRLRGDARLVKQILLNLLSNAVKFTPEGGTVAVEASTEPNASLRLAVIDTGIGIAAEDIESALTPFGQVDTGLHRKYEGTGLGLPLVKSMVDLHGGTVTIESVLEKGTSVIVAFPPDRSVERKKRQPAANDGHERARPEREPEARAEKPAATPKKRRRSGRRAKTATA